MKKLPDVKFRNAKPKDRPYRVTDRDALCLLIKPNGAKLWQYRYRIARKENIHSIGPYPEVSLDEARKKLEAARALVRDGIHPGHARRVDREAREEGRKADAAKRADTLEILVRDWLDHVRRSGTPKGGGPWSQERTDRAEGFLTRHLFPRIGNIPAHRLTLQDVQKALDKVAAEHVYTARLIKQWLRQALTWGRKRGRVPQDVLLEVGLAELPAHKHKHKSPLNPAEIGKLWRALDEYQAKDTAIGIRLLLLLFVRPTELREAQWEEIDGATWRISAKRTKMRTPHVVPLSVEAQALLGELRELNGETPFLFPGIRREKPATAQAWHECLRLIGWLDKFTPHAARATASTLLRELGYSSDWIEAQLAHQQRDETRASYDFAEYLPQRREMMARWSAYVVGLAEEKVKPLPKKAATRSRASG